MAKISKREKENKSKVEAQKFYALNEAVELVKALANAKFNESVDIAVQLGIDPRKSDQAVRGSVVMPAGTGKTVLQFSPRALLQKLPKKPVPISSVWKIWPTKSKAARWISTL